MIRQVTPLSVRIDPAGDGHFGAPRGARAHRGIDYRCVPGHSVLSPVFGRVTKLGHCYADDLSWRYVEVTDSENRRHRLFYVQPATWVGDQVHPCSPIGVAQDISERYPGRQMRPHVHYEVIEKGEYINPEQLAE